MNPLPPDPVLAVSEANLAKLNTDDVEQLARLWNGVWRIWPTVC